MTSRIQLSRISSGDPRIITISDGRGSAGARYRGELAPSGGVEDRLDKQADVTVADAGDGLAKADRCLVSEAGREAEHSALAAGAGQLAGVQCADRGFPVDAGQPGAGAGDAGAGVDETVALQVLTETPGRRPMPLGGG